MATPLALHTSFPPWSRCRTTPNQSATSRAPSMKRRKRNESGGICSRAAFVAGNVAPQIRVVSSSASLGILSGEGYRPGSSTRSVRRGSQRVGKAVPRPEHRPSSEATTQLAGSYRGQLGFAERTPALEGGSGLLHRRKRPFLVRIIEPPTFPKITGRMDRRNFRTAILVEGHSIDGPSDVNPVNHSRLIRNERDDRGEEQGIVHPTPY